MLINNKMLQLPLIQGGMGVGVSLGNLAGNVAKCGCMGVISSVNIGYREKDFISNSKNANERAFREEIRKARNISEGNGLIAVNIMVATNYYSDMVKIAVEDALMLLFQVQVYHLIFLSSQKELRRWQSP